MAYAAVNAPVGFSESWELDCRQIFMVPGIPGTTYEEGNVLIKTAVGATANAGLFVEAADSSAAPLLVVAKTVTVPGATTSGFPYGENAGNPSWLNDDGNIANSLVPCKFLRGGCVTVWNVPLGNYTGDEVFAAVTQATPSVTATTALGADDDPNGGIIYIYSGPGAGQWNTVIDYVNSTKVMTLARKFEIAPTTASSFIMLEGEGSSVGGIGILGRTDLDTVNSVDVSDGADDGDFIVVMDARLVGTYMKRGCLPVALYSQFV